MPPSIIPALLLLAALSVHADDLILDLGEGDSIRIVGGGGFFDCDDPAYADVKKTVAWTLQFDDGSSQSLCASEEADAAKAAAPAVTPARPPVARIDRRARRGVSVPQVNEVVIHGPAPADATSPVLHAVGVYQAPGDEVRVRVEDEHRPVVLALSAYESIHWDVRLAAGVIVDRVILSGYHAQRISGIAESVPIETYTYDPSPCGQCVPGRKYFYGYRSPPKELKEITGLEATSFQGAYDGIEFTIPPAH
jgi:hypothetical protein